MESLFQVVRNSSFDVHVLITIFCYMFSFLCHLLCVHYVYVDHHRYTPLKVTVETPVIIMPYNTKFYLARSTH